MIRAGLIIAGCLAAGAPLIAAAQTRPRDAEPPVSRTDRDHYGPLARYELLSERVDRKAAARRPLPDSAPLREWKRRQAERPSMDDDDGDDDE